ncbi:1-deoxy-D-xylulose-5-phosphate synthase [Marinibactrum halimedae]|uniref:1-deoxy-D-xylulose-5-phosphate synthase n=1 Tax=Marinibactrum halimedae TaxID=1444977 RepID=A0AA37WNQ9_9GAMM|nr:1-deoxy-D-xylulose-5-phosphate synthase [Marinibactrum halimedae]MCD9461014.1 1-deoxy-D-xylulose-5-phosphate synthase [Marinibactrum halimedae]GLS27800.1 1-deoxy-D-xylulose-5-phosphate synthase [Marinibactrum halimedae]
MLEEIPTRRPSTPLLDAINSPADLRTLEEAQLPQLADELRQYLLYSVGQTGGHFGAGLGVVELTIALHYVYNTPNDRIVWDVGHQTYPHKILTGRRESMHSMRQFGGLSGFPKRSESEFDTFGVGHSSTSISAALGMAIGSAMGEINRETVAVIGDGAMTAGMAFEALNHAAHVESDMLVILNDNNMSISRNVGGLATYFSKIWASKLYTGFREGSKRVLSKIPQAWELARKTEEHVKGMVSPGTLFEELGFYYIGPIDGHDLPRLVHDLNNLKDIKGPKLLHIITQKGKGFSPAEEDPVGYHALNKIEPKPATESADKNLNNNGVNDGSVSQKETASPHQPKTASPKFQDIFGQWLCDEAALDPKLTAITPAMCEGSGMVPFSQAYPERFHDVAIAEQHAVTLAAGIACEGQKPVVAIYSTFLQRGYDQLVHDVALQKLDVTFGIDRAGIVGEDGPTHAGAFDLSFLRCIPNMVIATPSDENECRQLLHTCYQFPGPAAVRYPRGKGMGSHICEELSVWPLGKGKRVRSGKHIVILNFGTLLDRALSVAESLNATVCDMRFVKPIDEELILEVATQHALVVTLEENAVAGGAGSAVSEFLSEEGVSTNLLHLGLPDDFLDHGKRDQLLEQCQLDVAGMTKRIRTRWSKINQRLSSAMV